MRVDHIEGRYSVHPHEDVTREPMFPGDVAEIGIVWWEVWADAKQDARGNWTCDWIDNYDTEAEAVAAAHRLAAADGDGVGEPTDDR